MQKEVPPSHTLQDHAYYWQNPFRLKEENREKLPESVELSKFATNRRRLSGQIGSRKYSKKFEKRRWILAKLSFRKFCYSKLSGLRGLDNRTISLGQKRGQNQK